MIPQLFCVLKLHAHSHRNRRLERPRPHPYLAVAENLKGFRPLVVENELLEVPSICGRPRQKPGGDGLAEIVCDLAEIVSSGSKIGGNHENIGDFPIKRTTILNNFFEQFFSTTVDLRQVTNDLRQGCSWTTAL